MSSSNNDPNVESDVAGSQSETSASMGDLLSQLRARRYLRESYPIVVLEADNVETEPEEVEAPEPVSEEPQNIFFPNQPTEEEVEASKPVLEEVALAEAPVVPAEVEVEEDVEEEAFDFAEAFDNLSQELRRLGREVFKTNRATESNQEIFGEAIGELRELRGVVARIPAQADESLAEARFDAKAEICRELLRMADTLDASLAAADDLIDRLQPKTDQPASGWLFEFRTTKDLRQSLVESLAAIGQWRDGQRLLAERLQAVLHTAGVRAINAVGRAFDPALHRAVSVERRNDLESGTITGEELKGYTLDGRILRYAEVIVVKNE